MSPRATTPLVLTIFDGWGIAPAGPGNAITLAKTPIITALQKKYPSTTLVSNGKAVGLPTNQEGNSEAGHMNIGAGRAVEQDAVRISRNISQGRFFKNAAFLAALHHANKYRSQLHLIGLLTTDQSGHADPDHIIALLTMAHEHKVRSIVLHLFTDGRDSPPSSGIHLLRNIERQLPPGARIGTIIGRFYAMDRKKVWDRIQRSYDTLVSGDGRQAETAETAILEAYERGETDEFIQPTVIGPRTKSRIRSNDSIIYFNLRSDRARELTKTFVQKDFTTLNPGSFKRKKVPRNVLFVAMTDFGPDLGEIYTAFPSVDLYNTLPMVLRRYKQLFIAESEKYAHVTFFFNGGYSQPVAGEDRILVPSPDVMSYDQAPLMSAKKITDIIVTDLKQKKHDIIVMNFANPDMLGHTGNLKATITAIETIDSCVGRIRDAVSERGGTLILTADHGNAEDMISADGKSIDTEHSRNPVPFTIVTPKPLAIKLRSDGILADVAPTVLDLLDIQKPIAMTGTSLLHGYAD
ncbi:MAG: 2,3-bisphosphoglycerate-independent phosphoglycerate mutase [Candidatus Kerfeldbacteria bacterium]